MLDLSLTNQVSSLAASLDDIAQKIPLQPLIWPEIERFKLNILLRRDDLLSPTYSGNKFYKLCHNVTHAVNANKRYILSFGGAYSNHLHALAALGHDYGLNTIGVVRGWEPKQLSPTLQDAKSWGMKLYFLNKRSYKEKNVEHIHSLIGGINADDITIIPEGGANLEGVIGCKAIAQATANSLPEKPYTLCSATATGTTLAGLVAGSPIYCENLAFSVLKGHDTITPLVNQHLDTLGLTGTRRFQVETNYHCGGYAKVSNELICFIKRFERHNNLLLDPVYTGKLLFAIEQLALNGYWKEGSTIIAIHSGGVQGRRGYKQLEEITD